MADLQGLEVVITRPRAQAELWQRTLNERGAATFLLPVMDIVPVQEPREQEAVKQRILALADYNKVIFVSQNAVAHAMGWVDRYWPQYPAGIQYFAVGSATARSASECGLPVQAADQAMNSEALLELDGLQTLEHEKVLICRGVGGRSFLAEELRARGAQVDFCELYHRRLPADAAAKLAGLVEHWREPDPAIRERIVVAHSGESLENFCQLLRDRASPDFSAWLLDQVVVLVPGDRVAELAEQQGFRRILIALNATDTAMTEALCREISTAAP